MAKIVNIEWMQPTRELQCPCCSAQALRADGNVAILPCSHFLFNWDGRRQDFGDFNDDEVESILDDEAHDIDGPVNDSLIESLPDSAVVYHIATRDEALGPVVRIDAVAFDLLAV